MPRWLGQMFLSDTDPRQRANINAYRLRRSAAAWVIVSETDDRVGTEQVDERTAVLMPSLGIKSALINQPIEAASLSSEFQCAVVLAPTAVCSGENVHSVYFENRPTLVSSRGWDLLGCIVHPLRLAGDG